MLDSGCTQHMTGDQECSIQSMKIRAMGLIVSHLVTMAKARSKGLGKIAISNDLSISNVLLVESLNFNLLSVAQLFNLGFKCIFGVDDVAPGFKDKTRYTPYASLRSQISHIATNKGNISRQCLNT